MLALVTCPTRSQGTGYSNVLCWHVMLTMTKIAMMTMMTTPDDDDKCWRMMYWAQVNPAAAPWAPSSPLITIRLQCSMRITMITMISMITMIMIQSLQ